MADALTSHEFETFHPAPLPGTPRAAPHHSAPLTQRDTVRLVHQGNVADLSRWQDFAPCVPSAQKRRRRCAKSSFTSAACVSQSRSSQNDRNATVGRRLPRDNRRGRRFERGPGGRFIGNPHRRAAASHSQHASMKLELRPYTWVARVPPRPTERWLAAAHNSLPRRRAATRRSAVAPELRQVPGSLRACPGHAGSWPRRPAPAPHGAQQGGDGHPLDGRAPSASMPFFNSRCARRTVARQGSRRR